MEGLSALLGMMAGILIFMLIFLVAVYIVEGIFLTKLNKLMYGKGSALAWIPIANIYLLGKLTINNIAGWILLAINFSTMTFSTTLNGVKKTSAILPDPIRTKVSNLLSLVQLGLLIYAIIKYYKLKKQYSVRVVPSVQSNINIGNNNVITNQETNNLVQTNNIVSNDSFNNSIDNNNISQNHNIMNNSSNMHTQIVAETNDVNLTNEMVVSLSVNENVINENVSNNIVSESSITLPNEKVILEDVPVVPEMGTVNTTQNLVSQTINANDVPVVEEPVSAFNQQSIGSIQNSIETLDINDMKNN